MRSYDPDFLIDGQPILAPDSGAVLQRKDLESEASGMDERGVHHRFVLRSRRKQWTLHYKLITGREIRYMQSLTEGKASFLLQYPAPGGESCSCRAYCTGDSAALLDKKQDLWKDLTLTVTEC